VHESALAAGIPSVHQQSTGNYPTVGYPDRDALPGSLQRHDKNGQQSDQNVCFTRSENNSFWTMTLCHALPPLNCSPRTQNNRGPTWGV